MSSLKGKVVLVTGSSKGIGAEVARRFAAAEANVIVNYFGSESDAIQVVDSIREIGGNAIALRADVTNSAEVKKLFADGIAHFGKIDVLVNNAGLMITKLIAETTDEEFSRQFDVNVKGVFNTLREASNLLAENGSVINFSSSVNRLMLPGYGAYVASKSAVEQLTRVFSREVGKRGITVNSVSPGPTATEMFLAGKPKELIDRQAALSPFGRIAETDDIAAVVVFLATEEARWINAQNIGVNGGMA